MDLLVIVEILVFVAIAIELFALYRHVKLENRIDEHMIRLDEHLTRFDEHVNRLDDFLLKSYIQRKDEAES